MVRPDYFDTPDNIPEYYDTMYLDGFEQLESFIFSLMEKSMKKALDQALDDILKDWK